MAEKRLGLTWRKHIFAEWLSAERVRGTIEEVSDNYCFVHNDTRRKFDRLFHERVHKRIPELLRRVTVVFVAGTIVPGDDRGPFGERYESFYLRGGFDHRSF